MDEKINIFQYGLENGQFPTVLYKYMNLDGIRKVLENKTLKFSKRTNFNDVYECEGHIRSDYSQEDWVNHYIKLGMKGEDATCLAREIMSNPLKAAKTIKMAIEDKRDKLGILCLTQDKENLLMWAHYADEHKGVCLEFDIMKDLHTFCFPKKVDYSDDYLEIDFFNNPSSVTDVIFHKSKVWEYEKEYRVVEIDFPNMTKPLNPQALTGIYFGCRCSEHNINKIKEMAKTNGFEHVKFYKMKKYDNEHKLEALSV